MKINLLRTNPALSSSTYKSSKYWFFCVLTNLKLNHKIMKIQPISILSLIAIMTLFSSCELVGDIFEAGVWSGILIVGAVVALVIFLLVKMFKK